MTSDHPATKEDKAEAANRTNGTANKPTPRIATNESESEHPGEAHNPKHKRHDWFDRTALAVSIILCVATVAAAGFAGWLAWLTHKMAGDARDAADAGERAWIAPLNAEWITPPRTGERIDAVLNYQNTGHAPALDVHVEMAIGGVPYAFINRLTDQKAVNEGVAFCKTLQPRSGQLTVFPSGTRINQTFIPEDVSNTIFVPEFANGSYILLWQGCFAYVTLGRLHRTTWCEWVRPVKSKPIAQWVWEVCPVGNHAD